MKPRVSFVVLSYNDKEMVLRALSSIKKLKTKIKYDVFVVDNGSKKDPSKEIIKKFRNVKVVRLKNNTGTAGYNFALKQVKSEYIYFTGCDIELKEDMLDVLVKFLDKNKDVVQVAPKYVNIDNRKDIDMAGTWLSRSFYSGIFKSEELGKKPTQIPYIGTGLIRKNFVDKWKYVFDGDYFFYGEDVDLGMRIRLNGGKIFYLPSSIVFHVGSVSRSIHRPAKLTFLMERNLLRTFISSFSFLNLVILLPYVLAMRFVAILKDLMKLRISDAVARIISLFWIIFNILSILKKRKKVQKSRKVSDKKVLEFFSEKYLFDLNGDK